MMKTEKENSTKPPFGLWRRLLTIDEIDDVAGCFEEMYAQVAAEKGPGYAKRWIFLQALKSLPGFLTHLVYWKLLLLKNTLEITLRNILKNKGFFLIKVFGLAAGVACSMVVILYVANELTYDTYHPDHERIYPHRHPAALPISASSPLLRTQAPLAAGDQGTNEPGRKRGADNPALRKRQACAGGTG